jgi:hypothetical protein
MDATAIGIGLGLLMSLAYALLRVWAKLTFELGQTVLVFLSAFSVPGGVALINAGFVGKAAELPSSWREYVSVAGIVAIGLALHYVVTAFRGSWLTRTRPSASTGQQLVQGGTQQGPAGGGEA